MVERDSWENLQGSLLFQGLLEECKRRMGEKTPS